MRGMENTARLPEGLQPGADNASVWPIRVYYEDTDAGGIVFYANYLKFFERARTEWLRGCGIDQHELATKAGILFVVRSTAVDYRAPARLDELLTVVSRVERIGRASVDFMQAAWRGDALLATGGIRVACVAATTMRPTPIPDDVYAALRRRSGNGPAAVSTATR